jgi:hypothetical protein
VLNKGFYELFSLLEKQIGSRRHIRCHTFNTHANKVVIVCSVITMIYYPVQVLDGHISTSLKGLSHEVFGPVFWPVWMQIGLNKNRFWFLNFKEAPSI